MFWLTSDQFQTTKTLVWDYNIVPIVDLTCFLFILWSVNNLTYIMSYHVCLVGRVPNTTYKVDNSRFSSMLKHMLYYSECAQVCSKWNPMLQIQKTQCNIHMRTISKQCLHFKFTLMRVRNFSFLASEASRYLIHLYTNKQCYKWTASKTSISLNKSATGAYNKRTRVHEVLLFLFVFEIRIIVYMI